MRKIVIDEMDVETRCRFEICSRKCEDETKMSKKLLTSIAIRQRISAENYFLLENYRSKFDVLSMMRLSVLSIIKML
ncbi:unnamed protein product [Caenorhabditis angaria]|uniref:Uncharacterized protein n=1 Tax=Caenorhabditis angaria TaxID=860376 RepID=A0A9P1I9A1_9PELO|nr:unnamed protein product [Caenorhabditis angaria]